MLQPLAFVIDWGLSFSLLVSLILVPSLYALFDQQKTGQNTIHKSPVLIKLGIKTGGTFSNIYSMSLMV